MAHSGPGEEVAALLKHAAPDVRALAARLAGKLDLAHLRAELEALCQNSEPTVREAAEWAIARITPDGGRGGKIIIRHGGYGGLKAYQATVIAFDVTVGFCDRFVSLRSRTHDQMVQAGRSGKQNIVEASAAAGTSSKTELKLTGVARASLEELLEDFRDFLRQRGLPLWTKDDPRAQKIRKLAYEENRSYETYRSYIERESPEVAANTAICVIYQATYLLDRLIKQLERDFIEQGGMSERMLKARLQHRREQENRTYVGR
ncbi:MAG: four helix bundle suffix domain-containing protein [Kiritimatiellia bacterium]